MTPKNDNRPSIYAYSDYRLFFQELLTWRKEHKRTATLRALKVPKPDGKFYSPQFLSLVFRGIKPLPESMIDGLAECFGLNHSEKLFLQRLVAFEQSEDGVPRQEAFRRLAWRSEFRTAQGLGSRQRLEFLAHGFVGDLYLLTAIPGFKADRRWINRYLWQPLSTSEITDGLEILERLDLVELADDGTVRRIPGPVPIPDRGEPELFNMYHLEQLELAKKALQGLPLADREFYAWGVSRFTPDGFRQFKKELSARVTEVLVETVAEFESTAADATVVARVNLNVLPVSRLEEKTNDQE